MKQRKLTFSKILKTIEQKNSERLMAKARLANRLAKRSRGANRRAAYYVKANALCSLVRNLPNCVRVSKDFELSAFVVVELSREQSGLHLPLASLAG